MSYLPSLLDKFLVEYLRVNEKACEKRWALPPQQGEK